MLVIIRRHSFESRNRLNEGTNSTMKNMFRALTVSLLLTSIPAIADEPAADKPVESEPAERKLTEAESAKLQSLIRDFKDAVRKSAKSEPTLCYRLAGGDGMTIGQAVELCGGTTDAFKTLACFEEAFGHPDDGGLGLNRGQAVDLCKSNSQDRGI